MIPAFLLLTLLLGGCSTAAADHERLGDRAYHEGHFAAAVAEYRAAAKSRDGARLHAKLGSAALHQQDFATAIEAFSSLKRSDPAREAEAAVGLERVAQLAARGGPAQFTYIVAAVRALRSVAPGRPLGRFGYVPSKGLDPAEALSALPAALASAPSGRSVDSLLVAYGEAQQVTTACEAATHSFGAALRRARDPGLRAKAARGLGACALRLGLDALAGGQPEAAERWLAAAVAAVPGTPSAWRATIGMGDARSSEGDLLGAALAYQSVLSAAAVPDSLSKLATERLNALGAVPPGTESGN